MPVQVGGRGGRPRWLAAKPLSVGSASLSLSAVATAVAAGRPPFVLGVTKPNSSDFVDGYGQQNVKVGAGVIRPYPLTVYNPGDAVPGGSWSSGDLLTMTTNIVDKVVNGRLRFLTSNLLAENCEICPNPSYPVGVDSQIFGAEGAGQTNRTIRYCTLKMKYVTNNMNGIRGRDVFAECNDISGVTDPFVPAVNGSDNVDFVYEGNYTHDHAFYAPDPNHSATATTITGGRVLDPNAPGAINWYGTGWNHADGMQLASPATITGVQARGNNVVALWSTDPNVSTLPLPMATDGQIGYKNLSCFMLNAGVNIIIEDNWLDGGEQCVNNGVTTVTGSIRRNKFGRRMAHDVGNFADSAYYALRWMASNGLLTYDSDPANWNVWEDTGAHCVRP